VAGEIETDRNLWSEESDTWEEGSRDARLFFVFSRNLIDVRGLTPILILGFVSVASKLHLSIPDVSVCFWLKWGRVSRTDIRNDVMRFPNAPFQTDNPTPRSNIVGVSLNIVNREREVQHVLFFLRIRKDSRWDTRAPRDDRSHLLLSSFENKPNIPLLTSQEYFVRVRVFFVMATDRCDKEDTVVGFPRMVYKTHSYNYDNRRHLRGRFHNRHDI